jgi:hypothetical protein
MTVPINKLSQVWIVSLVAICVGIITYGYFYSKNDTGDFAFLFGQNLVYCFLIWGIFHIIIGKKENKANGFISFALILCSLMLSSFIGYSHEKKELSNAVSEIQKGFSELSNSATDSQGVPQRIENNIDTTPVAKGVYGEIERYMKSVMNQGNSYRNDYFLELEAIGWLKILDSDRLKNDITLMESKFIIKNTRNIIEKYKSITDTLLSKARDDIKNINVSESQKRQLEKGYDKGLIKAKADADATWSLELAIHGEFEKIINLLSARKGSWVIENGQILFKNESDLNFFNSCIASIQDLKAQQEAIQNANNQRISNNLNQYK